MESLSDTPWDVVIAGTGLPQSLLALALSRSGKKILHLDRHDYYGGDEAALSLAEAERWAEQHAGAASDGKSTFSHAAVRKAENTAGAAKLKAARAYSLALAPQLVYCRSRLLPTLVSSQTHSQLDFQAVGSWFIVNTPPDGSVSQPRLTRVPGGREDVFQDASLDLRAKRSLMKFLRFVAAYEEELDTWNGERETSFTSFLENKFGLSSAYHAPILALTMSTQPANTTSVEYALPRISRHLKSIGIFGPGFPAVLPKYGGLAEIGQVACRAGAVGGAVYVLGRGITGARTAEDSRLLIELDDGEEVATTWLAGTPTELPSSFQPPDLASGSSTVMTRSISVIASPLTSLFPLTAEGGVTPVGASAFIPAANSSDPPVYAFIHSGDSGECPVDQSVIYASIADDHESGSARLQQAVASLLESVGEQPSPEIIWSMHYRQCHPSHETTTALDNVIALNSLGADLALDDILLDDVKAAWQRMDGTGNVSRFMTFEARDGTFEDDD